MRYDRGHTTSSHSSTCRQSAFDSADDSVECRFVLGAQPCPTLPLQFPILHRQNLVIPLSESTGSQEIRIVPLPVHASGSESNSVDHSERHGIHLTNVEHAMPQSEISGWLAAAFGRSPRSFAVWNSKHRGRPDLGYHVSQTNSLRTAPRSWIALR